METAKLQNSQSLGKEFILDSTSFLTTSGIYCATRGLAVLHPTSIAILSAALVNATAIYGANALASKIGGNSRLLKVCATISAFALGTLAFPWVLCTVSIPSAIALSEQIACKTTLLHLTVKTSTASLQWARETLRTKKPKTPLQSPSPQPSLLQRARKELPWKKIACTAAVGAVGLAAIYTFTRQSTALSSLALPSPKTIAQPTGSQIPAWPMVIPSPPPTPSSATRLPFVGPIPPPNLMNPFLLK